MVVCSLGNRGKLMVHTEMLMAVMPQHQEKIQRLAVLADHERLPTVTVVGKYNHGKSSLLNTLVGQEHFAVADKRQTRYLERIEADGVCWLDAPGLDADIQSEDDAYAHQAAWLEGDIRLFVHAVREGELDAAERALIEQLHGDQQSSQRAVFFVLSQIDQAASDEALEEIKSSLQGQIKDLPLLPVSVMRYQRGKELGQALFIEKSGVPQLQAALKKALAQVPTAREKEKNYLHTLLTRELEAMIKAQEIQVHELQEQAKHDEQSFAQELTAVLEQAALDLHEIMQEPEVDPALDPGTIDDLYRVTAGKIERSKIQNAYSRVCIHIRGVLTRHGVVGLPKQQQPGTKSLESAQNVRGGSRSAAFIPRF